jgi:hypothetical protein
MAKELHNQREGKMRATQAAVAETARFDFLFVFNVGLFIFHRYGKLIDEDQKQAAIEAEEMRQAMRQQAVAYRGELKSQLAENAVAKAAAMQEYLKEKAAIDALVSKIYAEDAAQMEREMRSKAKTREEMDAFMRERAAVTAAKEKEVRRPNINAREEGCTYSTCAFLWVCRFKRRMRASSGSWPSWHSAARAKRKRNKKRRPPWRHWPTV